MVEMTKTQFLVRYYSFLFGGAALIASLFIMVPA